MIRVYDLSLRPPKIHRKSTYAALCPPPQRDSDERNGADQKGGTLFPLMFRMFRMLEYWRWKQRAHNIIHDLTNFMFKGKYFFFSEIFPKLMLYFCNYMFLPEIKMDKFLCFWCTLLPCKKQSLNFHFSKACQLQKMIE